MCIFVPTEIHWLEYGHYTFWGLAQFCHQFCPKPKGHTWRQMRNLNLQTCMASQLPRTAKAFSCQPMNFYTARLVMLTKNTEIITNLLCQYISYPYPIFLLQPLKWDISCTDIWRWSCIFATNQMQILCRNLEQQLNKYYRILALTYITTW